MEKKTTCKKADKKGKEGTQLSISKDQKQDYDPYGSNQDDLRNKHGAVPVPKNFFQPSALQDVFGNQLPENHRWEQFFWTKDTVERLISGLKYAFIHETCCLTTPSLAHAWHVEGRDETLLDIDQRFDYLPKYQYYDIRKPSEIDANFRLLVLDPPFFVIPVEELREAVDKITGGDFSTNLIIGFLIRAEKSLRMAFKPYNLVPTRFELQYASIKPNKWKNFCLYSNIDLPGIKRIKEN